MRTKRTVLTAGILLSLAALLLTGCLTPNGSQAAVSDLPVISVNGVGVVEAEPDAARVTVTVSELRDTTAEAQGEVNRKVAQAIDASIAAGIDEEKISTASINFNAEYDWTDEGRVLRGQRVSQTLTVIASGIDGNSELLSTLFDGLGMVSGIEISSLSFFVEDTQSLYREARELAFTKAKQKAEEYAQLGGVTLGGPVAISEYSSDATVAETAVRAVKMAAAPMTESYPTQVPSGSYSVTLTVQVQFLIN